MSEIKPVAWIMPSAMKALSSEGSAMIGAADQGVDLPLYDQQAIDTLRAEVERQRELIKDLNSIISGIPAELRRASQAKQELSDFLIARAERAEAEVEVLLKDVEGRWDEWLSHALSKWPEAEAALIATRVALGPTAPITQDDIDFAKREAL